ncbi:MAG: hypothetical protein Q9227_006357 [Pyrenula ochraceoflavens]
MAAPYPGVTPMAIVDRQAGVDTPFDGLGGPDEYVITDLGPSSSIISYDGSSYHTTISTTKDNAPTTTVTTAKVVASTASSAVGDLAAGDVALYFAEDAADLLSKSATEAASACGLMPKPRLGKRLDSLQCIIDKAVKLSGEDGLLDAMATDMFWKSIAVDVAANASKVLKNAIAVLKSQAQKKKALIMIAAIVAAPFIKGALATLSLPKLGVGSKTKSDIKCDPNKEKDENSPLCKDCGGDEETKKCKNGEEKGCPCLLIGTIYTDDADKVWLDNQQKILDRVITELEKPDAKPVCNMEEASLVPYNVFQSGVYKKFCDDISKNPQHHFSKSVDIHGNYIPSKNVRSLERRTPPSDPTTYEGWSFDLDWTGGDGICKSDCNDSFSLISQSPCGHTAGDQNIMAKEGKIDTGCGIYSYKAKVPPDKKPDPAPQKIAVAPVHCIDNPGNIKCFKDVHKGKVDDTAAAFADQFGSNTKLMTKSHPNVTQVLRDGGKRGKGVNYMMNVGWIPDCTVTNQQDLENPVPDDQNVSWGDLLKNNYYKCTGNNGLGGWTDVGCLRYGFYPNNAGVFGSPPHPEKFFDKMSYCG